MQQAVPLLVAIVGARDVAEAERRDALAELRRCGAALFGTSALQTLIEELSHEANDETRLLLLGCLSESGDPRVLPVFSDLLGGAQDDRSRLAAAFGFASWNVRSGVEALVRQVVQHGAQTTADSRFDPTTQVELLNRLKGWGFPTDELRRRIGAENGTDVERAVAYAAEWEAWYRANKDRFPDWKPGDPLPQVAARAEPAATPGE